MNIKGHTFDVATTTDTPSRTCSKCEHKIIVARNVGGAYGGAGSTFVTPEDYESEDTLRALPDEMLPKCPG